MYQIPLNTLLLPTVLIGLAGWYICRRFIGLSLIVSGGVALIKISIPLVFFGFFYYDGIIEFDDYIGRSKVFFEGIQNPFLCFLDRELLSRTFYGFTHLVNVLYIWWNFLGIWAFGDWYSSPIFLNVGLTFIGGVFIQRLALLSGFSPGYSRALAIFYLLHWDVLAWSSFPNLKEIMIQVTTMGAWCGLMLLNRPGSRYRGFALSVLMFFILFFSRSYTPFFIIFVYALQTVFYNRNKTNYLIVCGIGLLGLWLFPHYGVDKFLRYLSNLSSSILFFFKFMISPRPWSLSAKNFWQFIPSILHLLFLGPCLYGLSNLWSNRIVRYFILYMLMLATFLSLIAYGEQRQRVQVGWIFIWAQFHFIIWYNRVMYMRSEA